jgi:hypothetical protein
VAEVFVEHESGGATEMSGLTGAILSLSENVSVDAALRIARFDEGPIAQSVWEARAGFTWAFEVISRPTS